MVEAECKNKEDEFDTRIVHQTTRSNIIFPPDEYFEFVYSQLNQINRTKSISSLNKNWVKEYNGVKGANWPICNSMDEFASLPDWIKKECIDEFGLNPDKWETCKEYNPTRNEIVTHLNDVIGNNLEFIKNKKIVDFGCNIGLLSVMSLYNGCEYVVATDVRQENLEIVNTAIKKTNFRNIHTVRADVHDYKNNTSLVLQADTVLLCGLLYHVHDHYEIIESITAGNPNCIIIETSDEHAIDTNEAVINWVSEKTDNILNGWYQNKEEILVGYPNSAWFNKVAKYFSYTVQKKTSHYIKQADKTVQRTVYVFVKE